MTEIGVPIWESEVDRMRRRARADRLKRLREKILERHKVAFEALAKQEESEK